MLCALCVVQVSRGYQWQQQDEAHRIGTAEATARTFKLKLKATKSAPSMMAVGGSVGVGATGGGGSQQRH